MTDLDDLVRRLRAQSVQDPHEAADAIEALRAALATADNVVRMANATIDALRRERDAARKLVKELEARVEFLS